MKASASASAFNLSKWWEIEEGRGGEGGVRGCACVRASLIRSSGEGHLTGGGAVRPRSLVRPPHPLSARFLSIQEFL